MFQKTAALIESQSNFIIGKERKLWNDYFLCYNKVSIEKNVKLWFNSANLWFKYGIRLTLAVNNLYSHWTYVPKSLVLFAIIPKKDFQGRIFWNTYSFLCRQSFHFFFSFVQFNWISNFEWFSWQLNAHYWTMV